MGYCGAADLGELRDKARLLRVTSGGLRESPPARRDHYARSSQLPHMSSREVPTRGDPTGFTER